jgi:hypothetical protein
MYRRGIDSRAAVFFWLIGSSLGGFGCEGAGPDCEPALWRFWIGVALIAIGAFALAQLIDALRRWLRR